MRTLLLATSTFALRRLERDDVMVVLEFDGQLDAKVTDRTIAVVEVEMATRRHLLLLLGHLTFIDGTGLGGLLKLCEQANDSRYEIELFGPLCPTVRRAAALAGLTTLVQTPSDGPMHSPQRSSPVLASAPLDLSTDSYVTSSCSPPTPEHP